MRQRRISPQKQRHEVGRYLSKLERYLHRFAAESGAGLESLTVRISADGMGEFYLPSLAVVQRVVPDNTPVGLIFADDSFLTFYEVVRFGYRDESDTEPRIHRLRYGYHYQRNDDHFYFRFDHHPDIGDPQTHPRYHLHAGGWLPGATALYEGPRFKSDEMMLADVLRLMALTYPSTIGDNGRG